MGGLGLGALLACALGVSLAAGTVFAYNWNTGDRVYKAGDSNVYFHQCNLSPNANTHPAFHNNDRHDIEPTDIDTYLYHGCTTVDMRINGYPYGFGDNSYGYGWYECHALYSPQGCDKGHIHVSWGFIPEDYSDTLTLVCQEVGLGHRARRNGTSCMSLIYYRYDMTAFHLDRHDKRHINNRYR